MKDCLLPIFEVKNKRVGVRLFAFEDNGEYLDLVDSYSIDDEPPTNQFSWDGMTTDDLVKKYDFKEVTLKDILEKKVVLKRPGKCSAEPEVFLFDTDLEKLSYKVKFYTLDDEDDTKLLYGTNDLSSSYDEVDVFTLIPEEISFDTSKHDEMYGVVAFGSLDDEAISMIHVFSSKEDAQKYIDLFEKGEVAPYIYLSSTYSMVVEDSTNINEIETTTFFKICEHPEKYKNLVLMPQVICYGFDVAEF